jgi:hypothetical protein
MYNLKGMIVGNGATDWSVDMNPSYPEVVYNFNMIPKTLLDQWQENKCSDSYGIS